MPVLPLVGSMSVSPGLISPRACASSTMRRPMRSLTEPPALRNSHLARISQPVSRPIVRRRTIGVFPMASRMVSQIFFTGAPLRPRDCRRPGSPVRALSPP